MDHLHDIFYIHNAIMAEAQAFETTVGDISQEDGAPTEGVLDQFIFYKSVLKMHESDEDEMFFPPMAEKLPHSIRPYLFDHEHLSVLYDEIEGSLNGLLKPGGAGGWANLSAKLRRQAIIPHAVIESHIGKENNILVPLFYDQFTDEELTAMMVKMGEKG